VALKVALRRIGLTRKAGQTFRKDNLIARMSYAYSSRTRSKVLGGLLQFFLNLRIDIADSGTESVKLPVDEQLKDSWPAINDFDCGVFLFLEAF